MAEKQISKPHEILIEEFGREPKLLDPAVRRRERAEAVARLRLLWNARAWLGKVLLCGLVGSLAVAFLIPQRYESTAQLMPPDKTSSSGLSMLGGLLGGGSSGTGSALPGLMGSFLGLGTSGDLFLGVIESRTAQDDLITKFDLRKVYGERYWNGAREKLANRTDVSIDKKSGIITISVTDRSPQRAAAMAQEYINELNWVMTQLNTSSAHRERVFLEQRLQQVSQDLETAEKNFGEFARKNVALDIPAQGRTMVAATASLEGELIATQTELQGLKEIYTDNNVRVKAAQARADELRRQLDKLGGETGDKPNSQDASQSSPYPNIRELPVLGITYADLLRSTKVEEAIFAVLTQEYELAKVEEAKEIPSVKVLDAPNVPEKKSFPPRLLISVGGALLFLAGGIVWILGRVQWQQMDHQDPARTFAHEVIGDVAKALPWPSTNGEGGHGAPGNGSSGNGSGAGATPQPRIGR